MTFPIFKFLIVITIVLLHYANIAICVKDSDNSNDITQFLSWLVQNGATFEFSTVSNFFDFGNGILATNDVLNGDKLCFIPNSLLISREHNDVTYLVGSKHLSSFSDEAVLISFLIDEKRKDSLSNWYKYIKVLPISVPTINGLSKMNITEFQDTDLENRLKQRIIKLENDFNMLEKADWSPLLTLEEYYWASSIVSSRALTFRGKRVLAPFADFFNHNPSPSQREASNGAGFLDHHQLGSDGLTLYADRNTKKGDQIFQDYGDNDDMIYVEYHGFVPDENPFNCLRLSQLNTRNPSFKSPYLNGLCINKRGIYYNGRNVVKSVITSQFEVNADLATSQLSSIIEGDMPILSPISPLEPLLSWIYEELLSMEANMSTSFQLNDLQSTTTTDNDLAIAIKYRMNRKKLIYDMIGRFEWHQSISRRLESFKNWIAFTVDPPIINIEPVLLGDNRRIGVVATSDLTENDTYLSFPTEHVFAADDDSCDFDSLQLSDSASLTLCLLHHVMNLRQESNWYPYLSILPRLNELDSPLAYLALTSLHNNDTQQILDELLVWHNPSIVVNELRVYLMIAMEEYEAISKNEFLTKLFDKHISFAIYGWGKAIVDSRSIWWDGKRHLVPLLDLVNCAENVFNSKRVHKTFIEGISRDDQITSVASTLADRYYPLNSEVVENYGQRNSIYYQYHGFVLANNSHDCVQLPVAIGMQDLDDVPDGSKLLIRRIFANLWTNETYRSRNICISPSLSKLQPIDVLLLRIKAKVFPVSAQEDLSFQWLRKELFNMPADNSKILEILIKMIQKRIKEYNIETPLAESTFKRNIASMLQEEVNMLKICEEQLNKSLP